MPLHLFSRYGVGAVFVAWDELMRNTSQPFKKHLFRTGDHAISHAN